MVPRGFIFSEGVLKYSRTLPNNQYGNHALICIQLNSLQKFGRITPLACDITSKPQLQATAERISQESGRVDVLVNNAGVLAERHEAVPSDSIEALQELLWQEDPQKWSQQFEVNVTGTFFTIIAFLKLLKNANEHWKVQNQGEGVSARRLSQVISVVGISAHHRGMSNLAGYAASKAALLHLMGLLSTLLAPLDVRCVSLLLLSYKAKPDRSQNTLSPGSKDSLSWNFRSIN
jgi:NAD(P)-dependent dehydrogenase (short-subunit alcohol dehydrogenase family)